MKRVVCALSLLLLVACAVDVPDVLMVPVSPAEPPSMQAQAIKHSQPQINPRKEQAANVARAFIQNQNYDSLDGFIDAIRKNKAMSSGAMRKMLDLQERIFTQKQAMVEEWHGLYGKGEDVLEERFKTWADEYARRVILPLERMNMRTEVHTIEVLNGDDDGIPVKIRYLELANLPDKKRKAVLEDLYIICDDKGRFSVCDVSMDNQPISDLSLTIIGDGLERENKREKDTLDDFRRIVGLSS